MRKNMLIATAAAVLLATSAMLAAADKPVVKVYLHGEARVAGAELKLADIAVIRGDDEELVKKASAVQMGRSPWVSEKMTIDRATVLARLASSGIAGSQLTLLGADKIAVTREQKVFKAADVVKAAEDFLQANRPGGEDCMWRLARKAEDLVAPAGGETRLIARLAKDSPKDQVKLEVVAVAGKVETAKAELLFKVIHSVRQVVATADIAAGGILTKDNVKIEVVPSAIAAEAWVEPYGLVATRAVKAGVVLGKGVITAPKPQVIVKKNQSVTMRIAGTGFVVTAVGEALEDGRGGDCIKVRNVDSKRTVTARVNFDGSVEPISAEAKK